MKKLYMPALNELRDYLVGIDNTPFNAWAKVVTLVNMNMKYEKIAFQKELPDHPYSLANKLILETKQMFSELLEMGFTESDNHELTMKKNIEREKKHYEVFHDMWDGYNENEFRRYIDRYIHRLKVNNLEHCVKEKRCIDFGCGNGNFLFAAMELGADFIAGVDFGERNIEVAKEYSKQKGIEGKTKFVVASIYETPFESDSFDFAIQNGVFHHLDDENKAILEMKRVLKDGGWVWYYTDGEGGISYDLWDTSVEILKEVPVAYIKEVFESMNMSKDKTVHITDGLNATYRHTSYKEITERMEGFGFGNFRRLTGGFPTDFDLDRIESDPYGKEKFGEGDIRILCQLLKK